MDYTDDDGFRLKLLMEEIRRLNPKADVEIESNELDSYNTSARVLIVSGVTSRGTGHADITIRRRIKWSVGGHSEYSDFVGFNVEFIEGEACGFDEEYDKDPLGTRKKWLLEYEADFKKTYKDLVKKYDFSFEIN